MIIYSIVKLDMPLDPTWALFILFYILDKKYQKKIKIKNQFNFKKLFSQKVHVKENLITNFFSLKTSKLLDY